MKKIRTRYAPSPTGQLHIGGARTALFCYLFAKHKNGIFIIRTEDTDIRRNVFDGEKSQIENLEWLGINADESPIKPNLKYAPYRQSERLKIYNEFIDKLIKENKAYICFDTEEEIALQKEQQKKKGLFSFRYDKDWLKISQQEKKQRLKNGKFTIRLRLPKNVEYKWNDIIRGSISFNSNDIGDYVIKKQDGYPTYNFSCVIDDHLMDISHVFRGEEHISNTPKQIAIYEMLNWEIPKFAHFTIITNMAGKKLSKRDDSINQFIENYKNEGYMPEGILNFLSLLGWSPKHVTELLSKEQIIKEFDINRMSKSPSKFDIKKLQWFSNQYFKKLSYKNLHKKLLPFIKEEVKNKDDKWLKCFLQLFQPQIYASFQIKEFILPFISEKKLTTEMLSFLKSDSSIMVINEFKKQLDNFAFTLKGISDLINKVKSLTNMTGKQLFMPIRLATIFLSHGPELNKTIYLLGKEKTISRINKTIDLLKL